MDSIGIKDAGDFDNGKILGSQYFQMTIHSSRQERASSETAYLSAFGDLPNLTIFTHTIGKKLIFDDQKKAVGVVVENTHIPFTLMVTKEVILSAGAFQSPQLLMVSGVGPKDLLQRHGIPVVHDNPNVGQNLIDHVWFGPSVRIKLETASRWYDDPEYRLRLYDTYRQNHEGPLTSNGGDFGAFEKVPEDMRQNMTESAREALAAYPDDWPEIEVSNTYLDFDFPSNKSILGSVVNKAPVCRRSHLFGQLPNPSTFRRLSVRLHRCGPHGPGISRKHHHSFRGHA
jgi:choline dehydrogenase